MSDLMNLHSRMEALAEDLQQQSDTIIEDLGGNIERMLNVDNITDIDRSGYADGLRDAARKLRRALASPGGNRTISVCTATPDCAGVIHTYRCPARPVRIPEELA